MRCRFMGLLVGALCAPLSAQALNKCRDADGHVTYSDLPCASLGAAAMPAQPPSSQQVALAAEQATRQAALREQIAQAEAAVQHNRQQLAAEVDALRARRPRAGTDPALEAAMAEVNRKYRSLNEVEIVRLRQLRAQLGAGEGGLR